MRRSQTPTRFAVLLFLLGSSFLFSGCVYLRLLSFKNQLKDFDQNVAVQTEKGLAFQFNKPVVRAADFLFITKSRPTKTEIHDASENIEIWTWVFVKEEDPETASPFSISFRTWFDDGLLERIEIDDKLLEIMPGELIAGLLESFGHAKINKLKRSARAELESKSLISIDMPTRRELLSVMGEPTRIREDSRHEVEECEYVFNFLNPENDSLAGQFKIGFKVNMDEEKEIVGFSLLGRGR